MNFLKKKKWYCYILTWWYLVLSFLPHDLTAILYQGNSIANMFYLSLLPEEV